jgi:hypothetical protein
MNCQIFETVVNDLAREQMMEANAREEALTHSRDCEACALRLSLERRLTMGLRALAAEMKSASASARVGDQLLDAFRRQTSPLPQVRLHNQSRYGLWAAAAIVLIAFGIAGFRLWQDRPTLAPIETSKTSEVTTPSKLQIVASGQLNPAPSPKPPPTVYRTRRKQLVRSPVERYAGRNETSVARVQAGGSNSTEVENSETNEIATQFLPLSYASPVNLQDGGQLVRVELPRSAMVSFGLPVNMERYGEKVKADVLVSADGLARAIRFVQ